MKYLEIGCHKGFMPFIIGITEKNIKPEIDYTKTYMAQHYCITIEEFRASYKQYANWSDCTYSELMTGKIDENLKKQIKNIIKNNRALGHCKSNALIKIYDLINHEELPFPINDYDMQTAEILYDVVCNWTY